MAKIVRAVVATGGLLGGVRFWLLPRMWPRVTTEDENQDECLPRKEARSSQTTHLPTGEVTRCHLTKTKWLPSGSVQVIRLTDDGELAERCELTDVLYAVRNPKKPILAVWYVHGWLHDGNPEDTDLNAFKRLIQTLCFVEERRNDDERCHDDERRHVIGIYVAWDGYVGPRSRPKKWARHMTFWNRKLAADRISQSAILAKVFSAVAGARLQQSWVDRDLTVMIGHSFGARILYTATAPLLLSKIQRQHPGKIGGCYRMVEGPADLILLLNPAFEASIYTALNAIRRPLAKTWEKFNPDQRPLLLAISTDNDWATTLAYPWGRYLEGARSPRQRSTLGNHQEFVTHDLTISQGRRVKAKAGYWYDDFAPDGHELRLRRRPDEAIARQPGNPCIVARTNKTVIDGHSGIWNQDLWRWLIAFIGRLADQKGGEVTGRPPASEQPVDQPSGDLHQPQRQVQHS